MAQLAIRFQWTWMGAVIVNNDYGRLAIQVDVSMHDCFLHLLTEQVRN